MRAAVFLDRDDTLNVNAGLAEQAWGGGRPGDLLNPDYVELLPGVLDACRRLKERGFALIVATNQGGVAFGSGTLDDVDRTNARLSELLTYKGEALIDAFYSAPYHPEGTVAKYAIEHPWRKPGAGMVLAAAEEHNIDLSRSWIVGDKARDCEAGIRAGIAPERALQIGSGQRFENLAEAAEYILANSPACGVQEVSTVGLEAEDADLLNQAREMVIASGRAIAERTGVSLVEIDVQAGRVVARLVAHRLAAIGFASELRRAVNRWAMGRFGRGVFADEPWKPHDE